MFKYYNIFFYYIEIQLSKLKLMKAANNESLRAQFGEKLMQFRTERNLSYRQLAQLCNVDHSQISKIEKGKVSIQLDTLFDLAGALNVHPKEFFNFSIDV